MPDNKILNLFYLPDDCQDPGRASSGGVGVRSRPELAGSDDLSASTLTLAQLALSAAVTRVAELDPFASGAIRP